MWKTIRLFVSINIKKSSNNKLNTEVSCYPNTLIKSSFSNIQDKIFSIDHNHLLYKVFPLFKIVFFEVVLILAIILFQTQPRNELVKTFTLVSYYARLFSMLGVDMLVHGDFLSALEFTEVTVVTNIVGVVLESKPINLFCMYQYKKWERRVQPKAFNYNIEDHLWGIICAGGPSCSWYIQRGW